MNRLRTLIIVASSMTILGGCATTDGNSNDAKALQAQLEAEKMRADENQAEAERLRNQLGGNSSASGSHLLGGASLLPPNAEAGHCYARVLLPAQYSTGTETVLARAASSRIDVTPAEYKYVEERVMVEAASTRLEVVPATYKTVTESMMIEPEKTSIREVPAVFETVTEKILVKPAYTTWRKGRGPVERLDASTGEIMCLVEVPAEYKTVTKKVIKTPATTVEDVTPARYETVSTRVVDVPASTREVVIPARYEMVKVRKLVTPASSNTVEIPAEYKTVSTRKLVEDSRLEWREILCETNTTPGLIKRVQTALNTAGYNAGPVDGVVGSQTLAAVKKYQRDNNMAVGQLTLKVLDSLKVSI